MGRRSINTTKSGKYMNPTDQARKEARKRELKKNKRQRMTVRLAVLKSKDPQQLLEEMEKIDQMEYDPTQPPQLNERVLKEKRRKLKETYDRVIHMYEKEDAEYAKELRKAEIEYEKKRVQMQIYYEQVKNAEKVKLDMIPLPEAPSFQAAASDIPLPKDIPLPTLPMRSTHGILKKTTGFDTRSQIGPVFIPSKNFKPPGPPPGSPPPLSDLEDDDDDNEGGTVEENQHAVRQKSVPEKDSEAEEVPIAKKRRIRFEDDDVRDPDEEEKDTRVKFKSPASVAHTKSLEETNENVEESSGNASEEIVKETQGASNSEKTPQPMPPTPMLTPGPPPMMFRLPSGAMPPPMLPPRMLPPGPPPRIRPPGIPPPGHPMGIRGPVPPPGMPPNRQLPSAQTSSTQSNILTGVPTYVKPAASSESSAERQDSHSATIVAAPKIRNLLGDVTRFTPTALKVKREMKDAKGHVIKPAGRADAGHTRIEEESNISRNDDAYDIFMKEMRGLI